MQLTLEGKTKEQVAIERIRQYAPADGSPLYVAFSGGKDSIVVLDLVRRSGIPYDAHYSVTGIDPPELVTFIKRNYPTVKFEMPIMSMWRGIEKKGLPTRMVRWCCEMLKERGGEGRVCIMGIRAEESFRRKRTWKITQTRQVHKKGTAPKTVICPILDWTLLDVWDYIDSHNLTYCSLYDTYANRLGCVGCPMSNSKYEFTHYPKIGEAWHRAAIRYWENNQHKKLPQMFPSGEAYWQWWINGVSIKGQENQEVMNI